MGLSRLLLFAQHLLIANVVLVLFNMLPAFPMDGGRVLRSLLAMRQGNLRATETAAMVGRWMAVAFAIAAVAFWEFPLLLVAGFVYVAGSAELMQVRLRSAAGNTAGSWQNPFASATFNSYSQSASSAADAFDPFTVRTSRDDVIDAIEVRELPRD